MQHKDLQIIAGETDAPTIRLSGEVDFHNAKSIKEAVDSLFSRNTFDVTVDVSDLEFIDSSGLSVLLDAAREARLHDGEIRLKEPSAQLVHVLTIAGFAPYFSITPRNGAVAKRRKRDHPAERAAWQVTQFEIPPKTELVAEVRNRVAKFARNLPFDNQDIEDVKLAVGEASSNALRYGCPRDDDTIFVRCSSDGHSLSVQIRDRGPCFDLKAVQPPPADALEEGGRGIHFMRVLMDEVNFHFSADGTVVELIKHIP